MGNGTQKFSGCRDSDFDQYGDIAAFDIYPEVSLLTSHPSTTANQISGKGKSANSHRYKTDFANGNPPFVPASSIFRVFKLQCLILMGFVWTKGSKLPLTPKENLLIMSANALLL